MHAKLILITVFSVLFLFFRASLGIPPDSSYNDQTIKGVFGLTIENPLFQGKGCNEIARYLKGLNINTVVGVSLNQELIDALRAQNIKVYAEVGIFAGEEYWIKNPASRPVNSNGEPIAKQEWYCGLCPTQEWLRSEKLNTIRQIVENFQVDGIWLDFIRYPCHWELSSPVLEETCFCGNCLNKFSTDTGISLPADLETAQEKAGYILKSYGREWHAWRCEQITSFVREAKKILALQKLHLELGLFAVPWMETERNNAIINIIAQDFKGLSAYVDIFSPMTYHKMCGKDIGWISEISKYMRGKTGKKVVPILQAKDASKEELAEAMANTLSNNKAGLVVFDETMQTAF